MTKEEIKTRVQELMASMTVKEKILQLTCMMSSDLSHWDIKELTPAVAEFARRWLGRTEQ